VSGLFVFRRIFSDFQLAANISALRYCNRMLKLDSLQGLCEQCSSYTLDGAAERATATSDILSTQFLRYDALFDVLNGSHYSVGSRDNTTEDNLYFYSDSKVQGVHSHRKTGKKDFF